MSVTYFAINGTEMPFPSEYEFSSSDFDGEGATRSETGYLIRDVVRTDVMSPTFTWRLQTADMNTLLNAIKPAQLQITITDPSAANGTRTFTGYAQSTRKVKLIRNATSVSEMWWEFSCQFTEY